MLEREHRQSGKSDRRDFLRCLGVGVMAAFVLPVGISAEPVVAALELARQEAESSFAKLDQKLRDDGVKSLERQFAGLAPNEMMLAIDWIGTRQHVEFIEFLLDAAARRNEESIQASAVAALLEFGPAQILLHRQQIMRTADHVPTPALRPILKGMIQS